jgi:RimJ/RimL family protein N-acetyltransferase
MGALVMQPAELAAAPRPKTQRLRIGAAPMQALPWLVQRVGCILTTDFRAIMAVDSKGEIRGMIGYCNWTETAVQAHMAVDSPIAWRALLPAAFQYPFEHGGRKLILATINSVNANSLRLAKHFGFVETYRIRDGFRDNEDAVLLEMRRENCRWLKESCDGG